MTGLLVALDAKSNRAMLEQLHNKRKFIFSLDLWEAPITELKQGAELEFDISDDKEIVSVRPKSAPLQSVSVRQTKSIKQCVYEYHGATNVLLNTHKDSIDTQKSLDFLLIKRFLLTAYNNLVELDGALISHDLTSAKFEILALNREYEAFSKKTSYPASLAYEKVFLANQIEYQKNQADIQTTQSIIKSSSAKLVSMGRELELMEERFKNRRDTKSANYLQAQIELKKFKKHYVDLLHYLSKQKEKLIILQDASKDFAEKFYEPFLKNYLPLIGELKRDFISLLNTKAYKLDKMLWEKAKKSPSIQKFFISAGINGTYSSKTFLKYFLKNLDKEKVRFDAKELIKLLHHLETNQKKSVLLLQKRIQDGNKYKNSLQHFDEKLQITLENDPKIAFQRAKQNKTLYDVIVLESNIANIKATNFIQHYHDLFPKYKSEMNFCILMNEKIDAQFLLQGRELGVKYFIPTGDIDHFINAIRMIL